MLCENSSQSMTSRCRRGALVGDPIAQARSNTALATAITGRVSGVLDELKNVFMANIAA